MTRFQPPKVYLWCNSGMGTDCQIWHAMAEDGTAVASHLSSSRDFGIYDCGPGQKGDRYRELFGGIDEGVHFETIVCDEGQGPPDDVAARNRTQAEAAA